MRMEKMEFTAMSLTDWMNDNYVKTNGKPFTGQDIRYYGRQGRIPAEYGGWNVEVKVQHYITLFKLT